MIINKRYLAEYGLIPVNYDKTEVMNFVPITERKWCEPLLGSELYDIIQEEVESSGTVSDRISTLLVEAIWPYLANAVVLEYLPFAYAHISEVGITVGKSDNSDSVTLKDLTYIHSNLRATVEQMKKYAIDWLNERSQYYPEWAPNSEFCGCQAKPINSCCAPNAMNQPEPDRKFYSPRNNMQKIQ